MPRPNREMPAYDDLDPLPGQRLPWEPDRQQEELSMERDRVPMPDEDDDDDETEDDDGSDDLEGNGAALYPLSEHLGLG
jgi:hypothetical protein